MPSASSAIGRGAGGVLSSRVSECAVLARCSGCAFHLLLRWKAGMRRGTARPSASLVHETTHGIREAADRVRDPSRTSSTSASESFRVRVSLRSIRHCPGSAQFGLRGLLVNSSTSASFYSIKKPSCLRSMFPISLLALASYIRHFTLAPASRLPSRLASRVCAGLTKHQFNHETSTATQTHQAVTGIFRHRQA